MKKNIVLILLILSAAFPVFSQVSENRELVLEKGVAPNKEIDAIYKAFSDAYRTLDVEKVANLYTENAAYLPPDEDILQGRAALLPTFKSFFDWVKSEGQTMTISFRIFQRRVSKEMAFDVGVYTIRRYKEGKQVDGLGRGKFVTVAVKDKDGKWRFQVDGYSNLKPPAKK